MPILSPRRLFPMVLLLSLLPALASCDVTPTPQTTPAGPDTPLPTPLPESMLTFHVQLPAPLPAGESIQLIVMDEVTGLALNPKAYTMEAEDQVNYFANLPFAINSVIKYRYARQGKGLIQEHLSDGRAVRYRLFHVDGPGVVKDVVSRWTDTAFSGPTGRISGTLTDAQSGAPLPNLLVAAGGAHTLSASDGYYLLEGLPPGTHNLVAYSLDGAYRIFQQGAIVAAYSTTPASLRLSPAPLVKVTFQLNAPKGTLPGVPVRLAGNLYQLGNTFADLAGGVNSIATRMPVLSPNADGTYNLSLDLPAGADIRYKYTLGDGLWNAEHLSNGAFRVRQLIVPAGPVTVTDQVDTWSSGKSAPITFDITVPANTPKEDYISIQFNPGYDWTESIPMWGVGSNRWIYVLYSPLDTLGAIRYRYCRNDQCGSADDRKTPGQKAVGMAVSTALLPETIDDPVEGWVWLETLSEPTTLPNTTVRPPQAGFMAGIEFQADYHPSWSTNLASAINDVKGLNANWLVLAPSWTFTRANPPVLEPLPGADPLWPDMVSSLEATHTQGLNVALFPAPHFPVAYQQWWQAAPRDFPFWVSWFERYRTFMLHHADLAASQQAEALIVGGEWLTPALPSGTLLDGSPSNVPEDAEARWRDLLSEVRSHYKGRLLWALPFPQGVENPPPFLDAVDQIYVLWSVPLAGSAQATEAEMASQAGRMLDEMVAPLLERTGKPAVLGLAYPSTMGWLEGCLPAKNGGCITPSDLARPNPDIPEVRVDLQEQVQAYNAMLLAINERDWVQGVVSRGYYPPAILHDKSASIHGKPARGILWYWFPRLTGAQMP